MFTHTIQNISENCIVSKECLIKSELDFFQSQLPGSSVRCDFLMLQKNEDLSFFFFLFSQRYLNSPNLNK